MGSVAQMRYMALLLIFVSSPAFAQRDVDRFHEEWKKEQRQKTQQTELYREYTTEKWRHAMIQYVEEKTGIPTVLPPVDHFLVENNRVRAELLMTNYAEAINEAGFDYGILRFHSCATGSLIWGYLDVLNVCLFYSVWGQQYEDLHGKRYNKIVNFNGIKKGQIND